MREVYPKMDAVTSEGRISQHGSQNRPPHNESGGGQVGMHRTKQFKSGSVAPGHKIKQNWRRLGSNSLSKHSSRVPLILSKKNIFNICIVPRSKSKHLTLQNLWYTFQEQYVKYFCNPCLHCGFQSFSRC